MGLKEIFKRNKKEEQRNLGVNYYTPYNSALQLTNILNKHSAMNLSAVFRATEIISDSIATLPIEIKENKGNHKEIINNHYLNFVFNNLLTSKYTFIKMLIQSVILKGNGFAYIHRGNNGNITSLQFLEASDVQIIYDKHNGTLKYQSPIISKARYIEPKDMIHLVKNTYDGINGLSVLSYANRSINISNSTENSSNEFYSNGCNLSGILTVQGLLSTQQRQDILTNWNTAYTQGGNGIAVLQGNMEYTPVQLNATDALMIESREFNVKDIARFFGISPILLGDTSGNLGTVEATQQHFLLHTLQPYIVMVEEEFNRKLLNNSDNLFINLDEKAILKTDKAALANYYGTMLDKGIYSINEVRKELGLSAIDKGDKHFVAYTDIKQNTIE